MLASPQGAQVQYMYIFTSGWISRGGQSIDEVDVSVWESSLVLFRINGELEMPVCSVLMLFWDGPRKVSSSVSMPWHSVSSQ